jgi:ABC-2 type transport system ATP-binding protein
MSAPAIETVGLGKRFGSFWALKECSVGVPPGRVSALLGLNGAGKTTLLRILVGLSTPSAGTATVLGRTPGQDGEFLAEIGYLAQDVPLYKRLTGDDHLALAAQLNRDWDGDGARSRLRALRVPLDRPVSTLSGGQRAQVGLSLSLAKRPRVLLLDEPVAALDPLARREFLAALSAAVAEAEGELSVVLSSHLVHDIEQVCDHMIRDERAETGELVTLGVAS